MTAKIWIEPLKRPDGRPRYNSRGQLYRTRTGGPDGPVLCERTILPATDSCRVFLGLGIVGRFETWHPGDKEARLVGDIEKAATVTVEEGNTKSVRFKRFKLHPASGNAVSRALVRAPARENDEASRVVAETNQTRSTRDWAQPKRLQTYTSLDGRKEQGRVE